MLRIAAIAYFGIVAGAAQAQTGRYSSSTNSAPYGLFELTAISRANCLIGANESITWDASSSSWEMFTESNQWHPIEGWRTFESSNEGYSWRSYAGCLNCGGSGWIVRGTHYVTASRDTNYDGLRNDWLKQHCTSGEYISSGDVHQDVCWRTETNNCSL
jgi:hypothetical protein